MTAEEQSEEIWKVYADLRDAVTGHHLSAGGPACILLAVECAIVSGLTDEQLISCVAAQLALTREEGVSWDPMPILEQGA